MSNKHSQQWGKLYGVGVGPGDPDLLTVKACQVLRKTPVICVPRSNAADAGYTWDIISAHVDASRQEVVHLLFPMTRDAAELEASWDRAIEAVVQRLSVGKDCVLVTEGDPMLYSTFVYIHRLLADRYPQVEVEIVSGVSSILAAAASAGTALADGDDAVAILPATASKEKLELALSSFDTIVLIKVNRAVEKIVGLLEKFDLQDKAVFVSRATSAREEVVRRVSDLRGRSLEYMSLIIVRK